MTVASFFFGIFLFCFSLRAGDSETLLKVAQSYRIAAAELAAEESHLRKIASEHQAQEKRLHEKKTASQSILSSLYKVGQKLPNYFVEQKENSSKIVHSVIIFKQYMRAIEEQMKTVMSEIKQLLAEKEKAVRRKDALQEKVEALAVQKKKLEKLIAENKKKRPKSRKPLVKKVKKMAKTSKNLQDLVSKVQEVEKPVKVFATGYEPNPRKVYAVLPVPGKQVCEFGKTHVLSPEGKGVVFETGVGEFVFAPLTAHVAYAGAFRSYKRVVILAHNKEFHTVLTGMDELDVVTGDWVKAGEPIGRINDSKGNHYLYLELRQNGNAISPKDWLAALANKKSPQT